MEPATKADLHLLKGELRADMKLMRSDLQADMKLMRSELRADMQVMRSDLEGQIKDLRVETVEMGAALSREINEQNVKMRDRIDRQGDQINKLRIQMVWMTMGVTAFLAGLITIFQFLS